MLPDRNSIYYTYNTRNAIRKKLSRRYCDIAANAGKRARFVVEIRTRTGYNGARRKEQLFVRRQERRPMTTNLPEDEAESGEDAVEIVYGEPVSSSEARRMGLVRFDMADAAPAAPIAPAAATPAEETAAAPKPPRGKRFGLADAVAWLVLIALVAALLSLAVVTFSVFAPDGYARLRDQLPAGWSFLPDAR